MKNSYFLTEGKTISGGVCGMPTSPKPKIKIVAQKPMTKELIMIIKSRQCGKKFYYES
jgi:hypothetical protein